MLRGSVIAERLGVFFRFLKLLRKRSPLFFVAGLLSVGLYGCSGGEKFVSKIIFNKPVVKPGKTVPKGGGVYKIGKPYKIDGEWYTPQENRNYSRVGIASWYGTKFHGRRTANGELFDMNALTAAHPTLPLPSYAKVTNLQNGRTLVVRINDRGPYKRNRVVDLSRRSAELLGYQTQGTAKVRVTYLKRAPISGEDSYEWRYLASQSWYRGKDRVNKRYASAERSEVVGDVSWKKATSSKFANLASKLPSTIASSYYIQAGSFSNPQNAERMKRHLSSFGSAKVNPSQGAGETKYRVQLGPFWGQKRANMVLKKVVDAGAHGARLIIQ